MHILRGSFYAHYKSSFVHSHLQQSPFRKSSEERISACSVTVKDLKYCKHWFDMMTYSFHEHFVDPANHEAVIDSVS